MSNALIPSNTNDMLAVAKQMSMSGYFQDAKKSEEAFVKIMAGAELGLPPFQAMTGIHVISGKPVLGAGLIASIIKRSGKYNYRVTEQGDTICSIDFYEGAEKIGTSTFTIEQAKKAGVKNLEKFPANMLFARAISNGAKWYTPDVFGGQVYAEGEIEREPVQDTTAVVVSTAPRQTKREAAESMQIQMQPINENADSDFVLDKIDKYGAWIDNADDVASAQWLEDQLMKEELPKTEKGALVKRILLKMVGMITTASEANALQSRVSGWIKGGFLTLDDSTAILNDLIEQARANGIERGADRKFIAPPVAEAVTE